jgi:hypothetical protein
MKLWQKTALSAVAGYIGGILTQPAISRLKKASRRTDTGIGRVSITFGIPLEQADFSRRNKAFLGGYTRLMDTVEKVFRRTFTFSPQEDFDRAVALAIEDPMRLTFEYDLLVKRITYYMSRSASEDFHDIVLLAANGKGIGAQKILRGMYERTVTAQFIAAKPSEAEAFVDEFDIQQWNILNRCLKSTPEQTKAKFSENEIQEFEKKAKRAQTKRKLSICSKCGQPKLQAAWSPVSLNDMAVRVGNGLDLLYTNCYLIPTAHHHATPLGLQMRVTASDDSLSFDAGPSREGADQALMLGHQLLLNLIEFQNKYWGLGLDEEISARVQDFLRMWPGLSEFIPAQEAKTLEPNEGAV